MKFKGRLAEAQELADRAGTELRGWSPRIAGAAFYELGEVRLRLGELAQAEQAFREADEYGRTPEPGPLAPRLAQGNAKGALASIRRTALGTSRSGSPRGPGCCRPPSRSQSRRASWTRRRPTPSASSGIADTFDSSALRAGSAFARGQVALARGRGRHRLPATSGRPG